MAYIYIYLFISISISIFIFISILYLYLYIIPIFISISISISLSLYIYIYLSLYIYIYLSLYICLFGLLGIPEGGTDNGFGIPSETGFQSMAAWVHSRTASLSRTDSFQTAHRGLGKPGAQKLGPSNDGIFVTCSQVSQRNQESLRYGTKAGELQPSSSPP